MEPIRTNLKYSTLFSSTTKKPKEFCKWGKPPDCTISFCLGMFKIKEKASKMLKNSKGSYYSAVKELIEN
jgi:hypothetical protein